MASSTLKPRISHVLMLTLDPMAWLPDYQSTMDDLPEKERCSPLMYGFDGIIIYIYLWKHLKLTTGLKKLYAQLEIRMPKTFS